MNLKYPFLATGMIGFLLGGGAFASNPFSKKAGESFRKLPAATKAGTLYQVLHDNPKVLLPTLVSDTTSQNLVDYLFARLLGMDPETGEYFPLLAEKFDASKDLKVLTFTLRKEATWDDGSPITADDFEYSYKMMMDPKTDSAPKRAYFSDSTFEKVDPLTFRLKFQKPNVNTIDSVSSILVAVQKKQFENASDFNKSKGVMAPVTSGPYRLKSFSRDQKVELELKKDWWGFRVPELKNIYNFEILGFRILPDQALAYEKFIKGEIDVLEMMAETFGTKVKGIDKEKFGSGPEGSKPVWAKHFMTDAPAPYTYVGWNLNRPVFQSKKTRQALAHLFNYEEIVQKVYHGEGVQCVSPFGSKTRNTAPDQKAKAFKYDVKKAIALLKEDGWSDLDHSGTLSKMIEGKPLKFTFTVRYNSENPMRSKIAQMMKEQFKKAGVSVTVQAIEFNALLDAMDKRDFDAVIMGWGKGMLHPDSKQLWHSKSAENKGSNITAYSNPDVDALIEQTTAETSIPKHEKLNQKIGALIYDDQPYAFLVEIPGFMAGIRGDRVKASKWSMRYDDVPPVVIYQAAP